VVVLRPLLEKNWALIDSDIDITTTRDSGPGAEPNGPASKSDVMEREDYLGLPLPSAYDQFLSHHNEINNFYLLL